MYSDAELLKIRSTEGEEAKKYHERCILEFPTGMCIVGPFNYVSSKDRAHNFNEFLSFKVKEDDVWIMGFPRSGTTWLQEVVWLIRNNLDFERARNVHCQDRVPCFSTKKGREKPNYSNEIETLPSPRSYKSHTPHFLLPKEYHEIHPKTIFIHRDPRDVCVSYYYFHLSFKGYTGTLDEFVDFFIGGVVQHSPYFEWLRPFYEVRDKQYMLVLTYEEMKKDLPRVIQKVANFVGKTVTPEESQKLEQYVEFSNMKGKSSYDLDTAKEYFEKKFNAPWTNHFLRKGEVGSWRTELSESNVQKLNKWIEEFGRDLVGDWS